MEYHILSHIVGFLFIHSEHKNLHFSLFGNFHLFPGAETTAVFWSQRIFLHARISTVAFSLPQGSLNPLRRQLALLLHFFLPHPSTVALARSFTPRIPSRLLGRF
jgi:hypothetical protein